MKATKTQKEVTRTITEKQPVYTLELFMPPRRAAEGGRMNRGVLARLLATVRDAADLAQMDRDHAGVLFSLEESREIEAALEEALEAETKREDEERFAKENAALVETRLEGVEGAVTNELSSAVAKVLSACERLREAVNP